MEQIFKPAPAARMVYLWDFSAIAAGVGGMTMARKWPFMLVIGILMTLMGVWQFLVSRNVLRTYFLVTDDDIASVGPRYSFSVRWDAISEVTIRVRPAGLRPGRPDRLVVLRQPHRDALPFNTSILSEAEENRFLDLIESRVKCPIKRVQDGTLLPGKQNRRPEE